MKIPFAFKSTLFLLSIPLLLVAAQDPASRPAAPAISIPKGAITPEELRDLLERIAGPEFEGRGSGATGGRRASEFIADRLKALGVEPLGTGGGYFQPFDAPSATGGASDGEGGSFRNVVGIVRGMDPKLKSQNVIVGAHYDHCGLGLNEAGAMGNRGEVHYGADDNGSGTATLLALARVVAAKPLARSVIFIFFDAEERGLWGSAHYCKKPLAPLENTQLMLNIDMVGRSYDQYLFVGGIGTAPQLDDLVTKGFKAESKFISKIERNSDSEARSDQHNFYLKEIPILFLFSGMHRDYHQPRDTPDKIQYKPMAAIARACFEMIKIAATTKERYTYKTTGTNGMPKGDAALEAQVFQRASKMARRLGGQLAPSADGRPMFLDVESAGQRAGFQKNDVILAIGKGAAKKPADFREVKTVEELRQEVEKYKSGDPITLRIRRDGKEMAVSTQIGEFPEWKGGPANDAGDLPRPKGKS